MATGLRHLATTNRHVSTLLSRALVTTARAQQEQSHHTAEPRPVTDIPGPKIYPIIGSIPEIVRDKNYSTATLHKLWGGLVEKYGPIVRLVNPGMDPIVAITDPDDVEKVNRACQDKPKRPTLHSLKKIRDDLSDEYFDKRAGIILESDEEWWRVRSKVQTPMMKSRNVEMYLPQMDQITLDLLDRIAMFQAQYGEMPSDFQEEFYKWALESVGVIAFGRRMGCLDPDLTPDSEPLQLIKHVNNMFSALAVTELGVHVWRLFPTANFRKLRESHQAFLSLADLNINKTVARLAEEEKARANMPEGREEDERQLGLMETLLLTPGLTRKDVVTFVLDILFAGIDTTSHSLAFALYLLAKNPEAQQKLQQEVDTVLGGHSGAITKGHLQTFSYLKTVVKETFRIFPITIGLTRILKEDIVLQGYTVPAEHAVISLNMLIGWDERVFPRVSEFLPERWLRSRPLGHIHPFASLPFGAGARMCVGRRVAEQEMYIFLARVMQRYSVEYHHQDIGIKAGLVFIPDQPLRFSFVERH